MTNFVTEKSDKIKVNWVNLHMVFFDKQNDDISMLYFGMNAGGILYK